ncbi:MAG: beta-glucanase (GH16 family) [Arcticibacterium sp.]|jgi:beta-glucanase (GH16 family)
MKQLFFLNFLFVTQSAYSQNSVAFKEEFTQPGIENFINGATGTKAVFKSNSGVQSSIEKETSILSFKLDTNDAAGAGRGPEIISKNFTHFGSYSARLKIPDARELQPNVGAVVGYFTYHADKDLGLSEIDFEWLLADPNIIYVGTWTGQKGKLERIGRTINLKTGEILSTAFRSNHDGVNHPFSGRQNKPKKLSKIEDYDASARFYTYGFDWHSDRITWWLLHPKSGRKIVLWDYKGSSMGIPLHASKYRMNFWHANNWAVETNPRSLEKPKYNFELEVDWMSYKPSKED